jgi:hypothetical protein
MRTSTVTIWLAAALAAAQLSFAQRSPDAPGAQPPAAEAISVSDAELETFAAIYVDLIDTAAKFQAEMEAAQTEQQALDIRDRAQTESIAKVTQRGWTPEKFSNVGDAINNDPALTERAVKLIEAK